MAGSAGSRQRRHRILPLGPQPQHRAAGGQDHHPRAAGQQLAQAGGGLDHLLQVVQDQQPRAITERLGQRLHRRARPGQVGPRHPADGGRDQPRVGDGLQWHEHRARAEPVLQPLAHRHRQPGLADPTRPGQRHQPRPGTLHQPSHLPDGPLPPQQRRRAHRQRARPAGARPRRRSCHSPAASGGEPLAQQHRQVITHQPAQLSGGAEGTVGLRRLLLDPRQQISQPGLAIRRRRLDIQQPRQLTGQLELLLQARDPRAGDELAVPLPVQPDENIALRQVRPVQLGRRIRPGAKLEHDRGQPQRRNGTRNRLSLLSQLTQRGTHEHPQPPVGGPDDHLIPWPLAHRSPLSWPTTQACNQPPRLARPRGSPTRQPARRPRATKRSTYSYPADAAPRGAWHATWFLARPRSRCRRPHFQHRRIIIGTDLPPGLRARDRNRHRQRVVRVVLVSLPGGQQPYPGPQLGPHVQHALARRGQPITSS